MSDLFESVIQFICKLRTGYIVPIEVLLILILIVMTRISCIVDFIDFIVKLSWLMLSFKLRTMIVPNNV